MSSSIMLSRLEYIVRLNPVKRASGLDIMRVVEEISHTMEARFRQEPRNAGALIGVSSRLDFNNMAVQGGVMSGGVYSFKPIIPWKEYDELQVKIYAWDSRDLLNESIDSKVYVDAVEGFCQKLYDALV